MILQKSLRLKVKVIKETADFVYLYSGQFCGKCVRIESARSL